MNINIYLFTYSNRCQQNHMQATTCIYLFMQITCVPCVVRLNIQYLFVYLFKSISTEPHASDHLYLFIYAKYLLSPYAHRMNINIYLFTYSNQCQQNHMQATTCIYLFMQITCCSMCCSFEYSVSICLLIQINFNRTTCKRPPVFVYLCKLRVVSICSSNEY